MLRLMLCGEEKWSPILKVVRLLKQTKRMNIKMETKHFTPRERSDKIKKKRRGAEKWKNLSNGWNAWKTQDSKAR